jgi:DNA (cytosine-5)-methyltransferase 1
VSVKQKNRRKKNIGGVKKQPTAKYRLIDLFAGCGGMTLGFLWESLGKPLLSGSALRLSSARPKSPFMLVMANDFDEEALNTYRANFDPKQKHSRDESIQDLLADPNVNWPKADVVIGGPPCQGFSLLNKNRADDERRDLWWHFLEVADLVHAKVIVMENVPQLIGTPEFKAILERLKELGFEHLMAHKLCAANYGVPQIRHRAIIVASRVGPIALPTPTHLSKERITKLNGDLFDAGRPSLWLTVRDAIGKLDAPEGTDIREGADLTHRLHFGRNPTDVSLKRYRLIPEGGNRFDLQRKSRSLTPACWIRKTSGGTDLFGRLWWDRPSVTIRTEFFKPEKGRYLHPDQDRAITHREAARLQSFPDDFEFTGSKIEIARQIGNAVPPLMAFAIAKEVQECLSGRTTLEGMQGTKDAFLKLLGEKITEVRIGETVPKR